VVITNNFSIIIGLDNESERNSDSSRGSNLYINNPESAIIIEEKSVVNENSDQNMKRSISAPLTRDNFAPQVILVFDQMF
jgi:hypothetical protein